MCGIAGFSLNPNSTVNARVLAHHLLAEIEWRGSHASGFAYMLDGEMGYHKDSVPGSQLPLKMMPRNAKAAILHTRFATQGSTQDNTNNHPVLSPDGTISVVHNGVISNDHQLRETLLKPVADQLADVDSTVIPAILQEYGVDLLGKMEGYAAIGWLDVEVGQVLNVAVLKTSPVAWTMLADGSFVFASTPEHLSTALVKAGIWHGGVFKMEERQWLRVQNGVILDNLDTPRMGFSHTASRYMNATSGGHGSTTTATKPHSSTTATTPAKAVSAAKPNPTTAFSAKGSEDKPAETVVTKELVQNYFNQYGEWIGEGEEPDPIDDQGSPMVLGSAELLDDSDSEGDSFTPNGRDDDSQFYLVTVEGDFNTFRQLSSLETALRWHAGLHMEDVDKLYREAEGDNRWVNHFTDVGAIDFSGNLISWVVEPEDVDFYVGTIYATSDLEYIKSGVKMIGSTELGMELAKATIEYAPGGSKVA